MLRGLRSNNDGWQAPVWLAPLPGHGSTRVLAARGDLDEARVALETHANGRPAEDALLRARLLLASGDAEQALNELDLTGSRRPSSSSPAGSRRTSSSPSRGASSTTEPAQPRRSSMPSRSRNRTASAVPSSTAVRRCRRCSSSRSGAAPTFVADLIAAFERRAADVSITKALLEPLSERERAILRYLPTMMSNAEIASELFVSVNTVKTHLKSIYRKLGAARRREAVERARSSSCSEELTGSLMNVSLKGMRHVDGGTFAMGSDEFYPEECPVHSVTLDGFWIDEHPVTAADFRRFVRETGYVTLAERPLSPDEYGRRPDLLVPGSLVFRKTDGPVGLNDVRNWWEYVPGAYWKKPSGAGGDQRPRPASGGSGGVRDAEAYAIWVGKALPTEAEWETPRAGGSTALASPGATRRSPTGNVSRTPGRETFRGTTQRRTASRGRRRVKSFPPNGYGLYDMCGNVWEWTSDFFTMRHPDDVEKPCCVPRNPRVTSPQSPDRSTSCDQRRITPVRAELLLRYRPAARQGEAVDTSTGHIGFRCIVRNG